jgi:hypothetical protein
MALNGTILKMSVMLFDLSRFGAGLPDFFSYMRTKTGKIHQMTKNIPHCHKIYQSTLKRPNGHNIDRQYPFQDLINFTQIGIFVRKYAIWQPRFGVQSLGPSLVRYQTT